MSFRHRGVRAPARVAAAAVTTAVNVRRAAVVGIAAEVEDESVVIRPIEP